MNKYKKHTILIVCFLLILGSTVSSAMACCWNTETTKQEYSNKSMPCHEEPESQNSGNCDCSSCILISVHNTTPDMSEHKKFSERYLLLKTAFNTHINDIPISPPNPIS